MKLLFSDVGIESKRSFTQYNALYESSSIRAFSDIPRDKVKVSLHHVDKVFDECIQAGLAERCTRNKMLKSLAACTTTIAMEKHKSRLLDCLETRKHRSSHYSCAVMEPLENFQLILKFASKN